MVPGSDSRVALHALEAYSAMHLTCNEEIVGSIPTKGSIDVVFSMELFPVIVSENTMPKQECASIIAGLEKVNFNILSENPDIHPDTILTFTVREDFERGRIVKKLREILTTYAEQFYGVKVLELVGGSFVKYEIGQMIGRHRDWEPNDMFDSGKERTEIHLGSVTYLNDDFTGGELVLKKIDFDINEDLPEHNKEEHGNLITLKPVTGTTIFFGSDRYHLTKEITSGVKYCFTIFYVIDISQ